MTISFVTATCFIDNNLLLANQRKMGSHLINLFSLYLLFLPYRSCDYSKELFLSNFVLFACQHNSKDKPGISLRSPQA